jgi:hypothetical protein
LSSDTNTSSSTYKVNSDGLNFILVFYFLKVLDILDLCSYDLVPIVVDLVSSLID